MKTQVQLSCQQLLIIDARSNCLRMMQSKVLETALFNYMWKAIIKDTGIQTHTQKKPFKYTRKLESYYG